jgi:3-hydroxymyristoyl/3-hydroxydecanoyl-(acyl carrier protein) dehydratase
MLHPNVLAVHLSSDNANQVRLDLHIPIELAYFPGHFPKLPVLPGVVQIDWAMRYARQHLTLSGHFSALEHIKFQSLVLPDAKLELLLTWDEQKNQLEFSYTTSERKYSSGRIAFGGVA